MSGDVITGADSYNYICDSRSYGYFPYCTWSSLAPGTGQAPYWADFVWTKGELCGSGGGECGGVSAFDGFVLTYSTGDRVSYEGSIYECGTSDGRCFQDGYEPNTGNGSTVWTGECHWDMYICGIVFAVQQQRLPAQLLTFSLLLFQSNSTVTGQCPGAMNRSTPVCPPTYTLSGTYYNLGDKVSHANIQYKCKTNNGRCRQYGWEPWTDLGIQDAWENQGTCSGGDLFE
jgi:hypothetical protein